MSTIKNIELLARSCGRTFYNCEYILSQFKFLSKYPYYNNNDINNFFCKESEKLLIKVIEKHKTKAYGKIFNNFLKNKYNFNTVTYESKFK